MAKKKDKNKLIKKFRTITKYNLNILLVLAMAIIFLAGMLFKSGGYIVGTNNVNTKAEDYVREPRQLIKTAPTPYIEESNNILFREYKGNKEMIYRSAKYILNDGQRYPKDISYFKKEEWTNLGLELGADDYDTQIYSIDTHPTDESKYYIAAFQRSSDHESRSVLYELYISYDDLESSELNLLISTENEDIYGLGQIAEFSDNHKYAVVSYNCVECEPGLYSSYAIVSLSKPTTYKIIGKATNINLYDSGSFDYQIVPQECIDMLKSYDDYQDSLECTKETSKETYYGNI